MYSIMSTFLSSIRSIIPAFNLDKSSKETVSQGMQLGVPMKQNMNEQDELRTLLFTPESTIEFLLGTKATALLQHRQTGAIMRFVLQREWGMLLLHKVGTGKTLTSLLIALNLFRYGAFTGPAEIVIIAPPGIYNNFIKDIDIVCNQGVDEKTFVFLPNVTVTLIDYNYNSLITDLNNKSLTPDKFTNKIIIFDEAHRLLPNTVKNSTESPTTVEKYHSIISDILFRTYIQSARHVILLSGTPIVTSLSDICRIGGFLSRDPQRFQIQDYSRYSLSTASTIFMARHANEIARALSPISKATTSYAVSAIEFISRRMPSCGEKLDYFVKNLIVSNVKELSDILLKYGTFVAATKALNASKTEEGGNHTKRRTRSTRGRRPHNRLDDKKYTRINKRRVTAGRTRKMYAMTGGEGTLLNQFGDAVVNSVYTAPAAYCGLLAQDAQRYFARLLYEFNTPTFNKKQLAGAIAQYVSVYDYELPEQSDKLCSDLTARTESDKDNTLLPSYPNKTINNIKCHYSDTQLNLLYKYITHGLSENELSLFDRVLIERMDLNLSARQKTLENTSIAKFVGTYSDDYLKSFCKLANEATDLDAIRHCEYKVVNLTPSGNAIVTFDCKKFRLILEGLELLSNDLHFPQYSSTRTAREHHITVSSTNVRQPHTQGGSYYLPLVYSYSEDRGLGPFAYFLTSNRRIYILLHRTQQLLSITNDYYNKCLAYNMDNDSRNALIEKYPAGGNHNLLEFNKYLAFNVRYMQNQSGVNPICVLLDPTMTEGFDAKYNPALFAIEPCNTFGDTEQVYGRVLRKYNSADIENVLWGGNKLDGRYQKHIYQFYVDADPTLDLTKSTWYNPYKSLVANLRGESKREGYIDGSDIYGLYEYKTAALKFAMVYPEAYILNRITFNREDLTELETHLHDKDTNMTCNDFHLATNYIHEGVMSIRGGRAGNIDQLHPIVRQFSEIN